MGRSSARTAAIRGHVLPRWIGAAALVAAVLNLAAFGQITSNDDSLIGDLGFLSFALWVLLASSSLAWRVVGAAGCGAAPMPLGPDLTI
ncbi:MAG: hypothetical protein L0Y54_19080 [Sporichthyaceae bacterium]|nr:hypothetical protein [Sporichthyaceae bacterium]